MKSLKRMGMLLAVAISAVGCCSMSSKDACACATAAVPGDASDVKPLLVGAEIPAVTLKSPAGAEVALSDKVAEKPSVIVFYRGGWCPFCNKQLAGLNEAYPKLKELGYQLIAISTDRPEKLKDSVEKLKLDYELLSDNDMLASKGFGIAFKLPDELVTLYKTKYGIDVEADSGRTHHLLPVPSVFLTGTDGKVTFAYVNPDYKTRLSANVIVAAAEDAVRPQK